MSSVYLRVIKNALCLEMALETEAFTSDLKELLYSSPLNALMTQNVLRYQSFIDARKFQQRKT